MNFDKKVLIGVFVAIVLLILYFIKSDKQVETFEVVEQPQQNKYNVEKIKILNKNITENWNRNIMNFVDNKHPEIKEEINDSVLEEYKIICFEYLFIICKTLSKHQDLLQELLDERVDKSKIVSKFNDIAESKLTTYEISAKDANFISQAIQHELIGVAYDSIKQQSAPFEEKSILMCYYDRVYNNKDTVLTQETIDTCQKILNL